MIAGNTNSEQPEEQEWEARKERMAQMEAILMSAINHDNIVRTYKVRGAARCCGGPRCGVAMLNFSRACFDLHPTNQVLSLRA